MLHGFDATSSSSGGAETVAFIPAGSLTTEDGVSRLAHYAEQDYGSQVNPHRYFVDGEITAADVYTSGSWKTILVGTRSEEHTSELQSLMRISYAVFCLKKKKHN